MATAPRASGAACSTGPSSSLSSSSCSCSCPSCSCSSSCSSSCSCGCSSCCCSASGGAGVCGRAADGGARSPQCCSSGTSPSGSSSLSHGSVTSGAGSMAGAASSSAIWSQRAEISSSASSPPSSSSHSPILRGGLSGGTSSPVAAGAAAGEGPDGSGQPTRADTSGLAALPSPAENRNVASSIAATEGSPPSTPRSTFSGINSCSCDGSTANGSLPLNLNLYFTPTDDTANQIHSHNFFNPADDLPPPPNASDTRRDSQAQRSSQSLLECALSRGSLPAGRRYVGGELIGVGGCGREEGVSGGASIEEPRFGAGAAASSVSSSNGVPSSSSSLLQSSSASAVARFTSRGSFLPRACLESFGQSSGAPPPRRSAPSVPAVSEASCDRHATTTAAAPCCSVPPLSAGGGSSLPLCASSLPAGGAVAGASAWDREESFPSMSASAAAKRFSGGAAPSSLGRAQETPSYPRGGPCCPPRALPGAAEAQRFTLAELEEVMDRLAAGGQFDVGVHSPDFKFNCAHFVAYKGFRERLHGHNYTVALRVGGPVGKDGYVMNFSDIKKTVRLVCKSLNEYFILPMRSDVLDITEQGSTFVIGCEDGAEFRLPKSDCMCLPIVHSTAEELAMYVWHRVVEVVTTKYLAKRNISWLEVTLAERPTQEARFRRPVAAFAAAAEAS
eukprot:GHVT01064936.1.p1 GENE.GHVT01064936.1~~GHVT01064936.1.p1  ORF type:complete len:674 (-),score=193.05 GHVT01064936.1:1410-3431(-)